MSLSFSYLFVQKSFENFYSFRMYRCCHHPMRAYFIRAEIIPGKTSFPFSWEFFFCGLIIFCCARLFYVCVWQDKPFIQPSHFRIHILSGEHFRLVRLRQGVILWGLLILWHSTKYLANVSASWCIRSWKS